MVARILTVVVLLCLVASLSGQAADGRWVVTMRYLDRRAQEPLPRLARRNLSTTLRHSHRESTEQRPCAAPRGCC
jgi:hypothetical protein